MTEGERWDLLFELAEAIHAGMKCTKFSRMSEDAQVGMLAAYLEDAVSTIQQRSAAGESAQ